MAIEQKHQSASVEPLVYLHKIPDLPNVHCLALNRNVARNAFSKQMVKDMHALLKQVESDPSITVLVIYSPHPIFSAGADLRERAAMSSTAEVCQFLDSLTAMINAVENLEVPTIAAMDGPALGGGLELALACDFRVVAPSVTKLGLPECKLGIIPGAGGTQRAPRLIGRSKAKELIFTGRAIDAFEARRIGLVDYVAETGQSAFERALELAREMSTSAPLALRAAKTAISLSETLSLPEGLHAERRCYEPLLETRDRREALEAFASGRRRAVFVGA